MLAQRNSVRQSAGGQYVAHGTFGLWAVLAVLLMAFFSPSLAAAPFAYIPNKVSNTLSVVDAASNTVTSTFSLGLSCPC